MMRKKMAMNHGELVTARDKKSAGCNRKEVAVRWFQWLRTRMMTMVMMMTSHGSRWEKCRAARWSGSKKEATMVDGK